MTIIEDYPLSVEQLRAALALASDGRCPTDELILLRDARAALARDQARNAVFDAATAAELAVGRMLEAQLAAVAPPLTDALTSDKTLGSLVRLLRKAGVAIPDQTEKHLVAVRNAVVHRGKWPSYVVLTTRGDWIIWPRLVGLLGGWAPLGAGDEVDASLGTGRAGGSAGQSSRGAAPGEEADKAKMVRTVRGRRQPAQHP